MFITSSYSSRCFAGFEVLRFDGLLRRRNPLGDHARFDRHIFFHAQAQHQILHALAAEDPQQIVLQRKEKARTARVSLSTGAAPKLVVDAPRIVALRAHNVQAAQRHNLVVILLPLGLELGERSIPVGLEFLAVGVLALLPHGFAGHRFRIAAQQNVGTAAGHVGRYRDGALAACLRHDGRFALVVLRVQHFVPDALLLQELRKRFGLLDRNRSHQHGLPALMELFDLPGGIAKLFFFRPIDNVGVFFPQHGTVRRYHHHVELVDLLEFRRFRFRRTGHARQLLIHAEVVLEGDGRECLVLAFDLHAFLGFHRLVQPIAPAASRHQAACKLIHDNHFAVFDDIVFIALEDDMGLERPAGL